MYFFFFIQIMDRMAGQKQVPLKATHEGRPISMGLKEKDSKVSKESIKDSIRAELKLYKATLGKNNAPIERSQSPGVQSDIFSRLSSFKAKEMKRPSSAKPVQRP